MKRIFAAVFAAMLCLTGCAAGGAGSAEEPDAALSGPAVPAETAPVSQPVPDKLPDPEPVCTVAEGVVFSLLQDVYPVGTTELTLVADNQSGTEVRWGIRENYEKYVDGQWQKLDYPDDLVFADVALLLQPQAVRTQTLSALCTLPPLDEGLYRVTGSTVSVGGEKADAWQVSFRVTADAQPEPDYALYVANAPIPAAEGCAVTDRIPGFFINTTGEDGEVLLIPYLEKLDESGAWTEVPWKDGVGFCGTPDPLPPEGKAWSWEIHALWGSLEDGSYRVGAKCRPYLEEEIMVYGEFTLYTPQDNAALPPAPRA